MYYKSLRILVFIVIWGVMFSVQSAFAFKWITRDQIIYDAIDFCPSELQKYLRDHLDSVSSGAHFAEIHKRRSYAIDPYETEAIYNYLIHDLKAGQINEYNTAHAFGVMACFIAETISPDNFKTPQLLIPDDVKYDGFQHVADVKSNISSLVKNYRIPFRNQWDKDITEILYNVAVNEIVDYWTSAWENSGFQPGIPVSAGKQINHQNLVLNAKASK
jgi:hypothetical protein